MHYQLYRTQITSYMNDIESATPIPAAQAATCLLLARHLARMGDEYTFEGLELFPENITTLADAAKVISSLIGACEIHKCVTGNTLLS